MLEIFSQSGSDHVRDDLDTLAAEIEKLDDNKREKLFACVSANAAKIEAENNLASARKDVREKEIAYHQALETRNRYAPPQSFQSALQDAIAANNGKPKPVLDLKKLADRVASLERRAKSNPELQTELGAARKELAIARQPMILQAANDALAVAQGTVIAASRALREAERDYNRAVEQWFAANADRPTHESLVRDAARRGAEQALAKKAAEPPETGPKVWEKQRVMQARGQERKPRTYFGPR